MNDHDRANRLYWESAASVNDIAAQMDLSKGALYQLIEPLAAEVDCPDCGSMLEYANRTALDRGLMQCSTCGRENVEASEGDPRPERPPTGSGSATRTVRDRDPIAERQALLGAGLLGAAALIWLMRR